MSATTRDFLRHLRTLAARQAADNLSDQQLLKRFHSQRSEESFAALVQRHGPMVWSVCRRVLHHTQDAEDAFQAAFLVLAAKAASLRRPPLLSSWLHGVAYHVALRQKAKALRRAAHERCVDPPPPVDAMNDIHWRELRSVLDEELQRMPQKYRAPLVLCYLEARTQDEAARHLGWSKNTFGRRMKRARELLAQRLTHRGITLSATLTAPLLVESATTAAVPPLLAANTIRTGLAYASGQVAPTLVSAQVAASIENGMSTSSAKKATIALALLASLMLGIGGLLAHRAIKSRTLTEAQPAPTPPFRPARNVNKDQTIDIKGRVLNPDGQPIAGARVLLLPKDDPKKPDGSARSVTDKDGRFHFTTRPADFGPLGNGIVAASAKGFGPDWIDVRANDKHGEITLRLVVDDMPIEGCVLDLEGKPIAGVSVRVLRIGRMPGGADLKSWLDKNIEMRRKRTYLNEGGLEVIGTDQLNLDTSARTTADGKFRLTGFGRDRVVRLNIEGSDIVWRKMWAVTRPGPERGFIPGFWGVYAARFDYLAAPCKPVIGTVREKGSGKPLAGIAVGSVQHGDIETITDKDGRFRLIGVAKNPRYTIVAEGARHFNCTKDGIADTAGLEPIRVDFELERGIPIRGRLTNKATGEPVRGSVYYCALAGNPQLKNFKEIGSIGHAHLSNHSDTAADGSFTSLAIPGPGLLCVRADSGAFIEAKPMDPSGVPLKPVPNIVLTGHHALVPVNLSDKDPKTYICDIALDPGRALKGTVIGPDGIPLPNVLIMGLTSTWTGSEGKARQDASFTVTGLEAGRERTLIFCHEEKQLGKALQLRGDEKGPLTVALEPLVNITGRMVDASGRPMAGLTVRVRQAFDRKTTTDKHGKFRVEGLLPRRKFVLVLAHGDPWERRSTIVFFDDGLSVESGATKDLGDLKPKPPKRK